MRKPPNKEIRLVREFGGKVIVSSIPRSASEDSESVVTWGKQ